MVAPAARAARADKQEPAEARAEPAEQHHPVVSPAQPVPPEDTAAPDTGAPPAPEATEFTGLVVPVASVAPPPAELRTVQRALMATLR
jgi:hypothetical protein